MSYDWMNPPKPAVQLDDHVVRYALAKVTRRLKAGGYASADCYYADKDCARDLSARLVGKRPHEIDPAGFWFGMQSN